MLNKLKFSKSNSTFTKLLFDKINHLLKFGKYIILILQVKEKKTPYFANENSHINSAKCNKHQWAWRIFWFSLPDVKQIVYFRIYIPAENRLLPPRSNVQLWKRLYLCMLKSQKSASLPPVSYIKTRWISLNHLTPCIPHQIPLLFIVNTYLRLF